MIRQTISGHRRFVILHFEQRADKGRDRDFAVFINTHIENIVGIGFILKPCAAVGNHGRGKQFFTGFIITHAIIYARGAHQLRNNNTFRTVDHKSAAFGHQREIAHEDILLFHLAGLFIQKAGANTQRCGIGNIPFLTLFNRVFGRFIQMVIDEIQDQVTGVVGNGGYILEHLFEALIQKPLV